MYFCQKECKCISSKYLIWYFDPFYSHVFLVHLTTQLQVRKVQTHPKYDMLRFFFVTIRSLLFCFVFMYSTAWLKLFIFFMKQYNVNCISVLIKCNCINAMLLFKFEIIACFEKYNMIYFLGVLIFLDILRKCSSRCQKISPEILFRI